MNTRYATSRRSVLFGALFTAAAVTFGGLPAHATDHLKVGIMSGPEEEILAVVKQVAAKEGLDLELVTFSDYVLPNEALNSAELHPHPFPHAPSLSNQL